WRALARLQEQLPSRSMPLRAGPARGGISAHRVTLTPAPWSGQHFASSFLQTPDCNLSRSASPPPAQAQKNGPAKAGPSFIDIQLQRVSATGAELVLGFQEDLATIHIVVVLVIRHVRGTRHGVIHWR